MELYEEIQKLMFAQTDNYYWSYPKLTSNKDIYWSMLDNDKFDVLMNIVNANAEWKKDLYDKHIPDDMVKKYADYLDWETISIYKSISDKMIDAYSDKINWHFISKCKKHSMSFLEKYIDKLDFDEISIYQDLSIQFMEKYRDKLNWLSLTMYQILSEVFITNNMDYLDEACWKNISVYQKLSKTFIDNYADKLSWSAITKFQNIADEDLMEKYKQNIDWDLFSLYQKVPSIKKYIKLLNICYLCKNKKVIFDCDFIEENISSFSREMMLDVFNKQSICNSDLLEKICHPTVGIINLEKDYAARYAISKMSVLPKPFIINHKDELCWDAISHESLALLPYSIIEEKYRYLSADNINYVCKYIELPEEMLDKISETGKVDWDTISMMQNLSEGFISNHKHDVIWEYISVYQKLSDEFLINNSSLIYWPQYIASHVSNLNEEVIVRCCNDIDLKFAGRFIDFSGFMVDAIMDGMLKPTSRYYESNSKFIEAMHNEYVEKAKNVEILANDTANNKNEKKVSKVKNIVIDGIINFLTKLRS